MKITVLGDDMGTRGLLDDMEHISKDCGVRVWGFKLSFALVD